MMINASFQLNQPSEDPRLDRLNDALATGEPVKIVVALFDLDASGAARDKLQRLGTNPGLWDVLAILNSAGIRLRAE